MNTNIGGIYGVSRDLSLLPSEVSQEACGEAESAPIAPHGKMPPWLLAILGPSQGGPGCSPLFAISP